MRKFLFIIILLSMSLYAVIAQSPKAFKYQAVARDEAGNIITNTDLSIRIKILEGLITETNVYTETHDVKANAHGLINLTIGEGIVESGSMDDIDWGNNNYLLQVEIADADDIDYQILGKAQLVSVPYAMYADKAGNVFSGDYNDLINIPDLSDTANYLTDEVDGSVTNEIQDLYLENDSLKITNSNGISLDSLGSSPWQKNGDNIYYNAGNIGIGTDNPSTFLVIDGAGSEAASVQINRPTTSNTYSSGLTSSVDAPPNNSSSTFGLVGNAPSGVGYSFGVKGQATSITPSGSGRAYGIIGYASNATPGYNYGAFGFLMGSNNGAAVFGKTDDGSSEEVLNGQWAGYFLGKVYVRNNLGIGTTLPERPLHINDVMRIEPRATAPSSPSEGDIYMDATTHTLMVYDGTIWQACW